MNSLTDFFENYVITVGQGSNMVQSISVSDGEVFFVLTRGAITIPIENALAIAVDTDEDGVPMAIMVDIHGYAHHFYFHKNFTTIGATDFTFALKNHLN